MKLKIYFSIMVLLCLNMNAFSQIDPLRKKLDSIFQYIDKSQIPTMYLKEYGSQFLPIHRFNGVLTDSNIVNNLDVFRTAYCDLLTAKLPAPKVIITPQARFTFNYLLKPLAQVNNDMAASASNNISAVAILYGKYASLKPTAVTENLLTINNQQFWDVPNRPSSPYLTNTLFVAAAIKTKFINTVSLKLDTAFFYRNTNTFITNAFIDFKDGNGFIPLTTSGITKTYTDSTGNKPIIIKAILSDGNTVQCNSSVFLKVTTSAIANRYSDTLAATIAVPIVAADSLGIGDSMQIRYSLQNPTRNLSAAARRVRKPLIYVEGYDPAGDYDIYDLIRNNGINKDGEWITLFTETGYNFIDSLDDRAGYDLIFINYNTLRSFEQNTLMLQHVIEWVNIQKNDINSTEQNVVLGVSAGGLLARYTLARMTKQFGAPSTQTRLLITMDSPHQGANVPLSLQHFLYDLGNQTVAGQQIKETVPDLKNFTTLNNAPATAQLLRARVLDANGTVVFNTFLNNGDSTSPYQQMVRFTATNPTPTYRFVAVAQGSQCGIQVAAPSVVFAQQNNRFALITAGILLYASEYRLETELKALPDNGSQQIEYFKFTRENAVAGFSLGTTVLAEYSRYNPSNFTKWDVVPGGTQSINGRTNGALSTGTQYVPLSSSFLVNLNLFFYGISAQAGGSLNINNDLFSFVSTTSALDAMPNISPYSTFNFAQNGNVNTATNRFIAQEAIAGTSLFNKNHTDYTARNARWIFNEMQNTTQPLNCIDYCYNYKIIGSEELCNTETYSVLNAPPNANIIWSYSLNNNGLSIIANGSSAIVTKIYNGTYTLQAIINIPGCASSTITKTIFGGGRIISQSGTYLNYNGNDTKPWSTWTNLNTTMGPNFTTTFKLKMDAASNFYFNPHNSMTINWSYVNYAQNEIALTVSYPFGIVVGQVGSFNNCGLYTSNIFYISLNGGGAGRQQLITSTPTFTATPNPVNDILNVKVLDAENNEVKVGGDYLIKISELGTLLRIKQFRVKKIGNSFQINMEGLKRQGKRF
jgi:hypothetical protein